VGKPGERVDGGAGVRVGIEAHAALGADVSTIHRKLYQPARFVPPESPRRRKKCQFPRGAGRPRALRTGRDNGSINCCGMLAGPRSGGLDESKRRVSS
jgi:hypothetical protein